MLYRSPKPFNEDVINPAPLAIHAHFSGEMVVSDLRRLGIPSARRQHLQERNFADAANLHGFKRARWRGLWRQSLQDYLIAALQNLQLLIRAAFRPDSGLIERLETIFSTWLMSLASLRPMKRFSNVT